jgi:hypothetical protein
MDPSNPTDALYRAVEALCRIHIELVFLTLATLANAVATTLVAFRLSKRG